MYNKIDKDVLTTTEVFSEWVSLLKWEAILCFDPNYGDDTSLYNMLTQKQELLR